MVTSNLEPSTATVSPFTNPTDRANRTNSARFYETAGGVKIKLVLVLLLVVPFCIWESFVFAVAFVFPQAFISGFYAHSLAPLGRVLAGVRLR